MALFNLTMSHHYRNARYGRNANVDFRISDGWMKLGNVLKAQGNLEEAIYAYKTATSLSPRNGMALYNLVQPAPVLIYVSVVCSTAVMLAVRLYAYCYTQYHSTRSAKPGIAVCVARYAVPLRA
eukprot:2298501-Rhodomonas_salina.2